SAPGRALRTSGSGARSPEANARRRGRSTRGAVGADEDGGRTTSGQPLGEAGRVIREQLLARPPNRRGLAFPTANGGVWRKDTFMARVFRPAVRRAELAPLRFHDLRHTYAALMVAAGAHPKLLQAQLGHTSINVTLNTYGHLYPDAFADVGDALDR